MRKLFSIFSLGILIFSSLVPSFTYANKDIEGLSNLLSSFLDDASSKVQGNTTQINSTPELKTFWIEEPELDEIEILTDNKRVVVRNKTQKNITVYPTDYSTWITIKDRNLWATKYLWEEWANENEIIWNYYQWWKSEPLTVDNFNNTYSADPNYDWNICESNYHIPKKQEWESLTQLYNFFWQTNDITFMENLKFSYWWLIINVENNEFVYNDNNPKWEWWFYWNNQYDSVNKYFYNAAVSLAYWWVSSVGSAKSYIWSNVRCFKDNYMETLALKIWDETILTQFEHWESFDKSLTWQLLSNIDIPEWYHVEWYITWDNNELTWFDFDNEEITTTMTLIWEVVNDNNWIFDLGNWIRKVVWNNKSIKYDTNLIGWIQWWANASWEPYSNDNNAWWWANDDIDNQFWAWNNWFWRQWPCQDWWHVASNWEWKTLVNYLCYNNPNCNSKENINDDYWSPIILSNYSNRQSLLWFNLEPWRAIRTSSFISWINFVWIGNNYIEVYDTVVQYYYINYRNTNVNANIPKNAPINVLCIDNYYATITFKNKKDETIIIDSISDIEKDKKINLNQLPEQEEWYTNHYYLKNNGEFEEIENILELIITSDLDIYVESVQNIIPSEPDSVSSPVSHTSGWSGRPISTIKQETKLEQEHNSADTEENKTREQTATSVTAKSEKKTVEEKIEIIKPKALTRWELAVFSNILTEVFPQLTEWKKNVNEVCNEYTDYKEFSAKEEKAVSKLCRLAIMGIIEDDKTPLETFGINNLSTNEEFIKVVNRMTDKYSEEELKDLKSALSTLENQKEDNLVFGTVYDIFMKVKALF